MLIFWKPAKVLSSWVSRSVSVTLIPSTVSSAERWLLSIHIYGYGTDNVCVVFPLRPPFPGMLPGNILYLPLTVGCERHPHTSVLRWILGSQAAGFVALRILRMDANSARYFQLDSDLC